MNATHTVEPVLDQAQVDIEQQLVQTAKDLHDAILAQAPTVEERTFYSEELHAKFDEAGFYRMLIPKAHGGLEVTPATFYRVVIEIARADMSTAWCFALSSNHALMVANWFPADIHAEVYNGGDFRAASMYAPTVTATPVDGGWQLDGVVNYCSGIPYSTYFVGQCILPGTRPTGDPRVGVYIAPRDSFTMLDDWGNMLGLNGSGSHSIRFDGAILPGRFLVEDADLVEYAFDGDSPGSAAYGNSMYSGRHMSSFAFGIAAIMIGGCYGALDEFERQMRARKTTIPPFVSRTDDPDFQRWYGSALVKFELAEGAFFSAVDRWLEATRRNVAGIEPFSDALDNLLGGIGREVMIQVWEAFDRDLYRTIGSTASKKGERFEHIYRDMSQAIGHRNPQLKEPSYRLIAMGALGIPFGPA
ncbi:MAG: acyl-CoA dehydrogenase family protein [Pseudoclavibacter sp.]